MFNSTIDKNNTNMNIEPRLLLYDGYDVYRYASLNNVIINCDADDHIIFNCIDNAGDCFGYLISTDNQKFDIEKLKCKSFEEFLIALDLHNLLHGVLTNDNKNKSLNENLLMIENAKLKEENEKLKKKILKMKKLFDD